MPDAALWFTTVDAWIQAHPGWASLVIGAALALAAWASFALTRRYLVVYLGRLGKRTLFRWDEALQERSFYRRLAWAVPLLIVRAGLPLLPVLPGAVATAAQRGVAVGMLAVLASAIGAFLAAIGDVYEQRMDARQRPIKGYLQAMVLVAYLLIIMVAIATLLGRDPLLIVGGLGAVSAVLLLVFRDTLLSLVAGIQLTGYDLIRVGDWIEMPEFHADGPVVDIALNTVKVQNWDRTFTVIPAHRFLDVSFKNWRGMQASGGRRIMRSLTIDLATVRFLSEAEVEDLRRFTVLRPYFARKRAEIAEWTEQHPEAREHQVNARRLTNLGTFRAYIEGLLRAHPEIQIDATFMVRQLEPTPEGLPLQVYMFVADTRWTAYEAIQSDVFDHLIAIAPEFGLRLYQKPSGTDLRSLSAVAADAGASAAGIDAPFGAEGRRST
ncbi:MAG: mechanosensitive ion channel family protein [Trueperaceae bacterium]|nr:mechanosensitive ion channel family protein [Trueperaceae bacterium]